jgi:transcriptional regulator with XRE-family HTH domain
VSGCGASRWTSRSKFSAFPVDLTFQQIQKYEKGVNRIGASRLQQIGKILEVPAAYFFERRARRLAACRHRR